MGKKLLCCVAKKKCSVVVCINYAGVFHKSSATRNKNYKIVSDSLIKCCEPKADGLTQDNANEATTSGNSEGTTRKLNAEEAS